MAKLLPNHQGTLLQADVIDIIHDKVVSLCQKKYSSVNFLEIDGLICISVLDTKEQQVVKIHKTLTSISGKPLKRNTTKNNGRSHLLHELITHSGNGLDGVQQDSGVAQNDKQENFQNDINVLSELLKNTTEKILTDNLQRQSESEGPLKSGRRKRKQSHPRAFPTDENEVTDPKRNKLTDEAGTEDPGDYNAPGINPFLHREAVMSMPSRGSSAEVGEKADVSGLTSIATVKSEPKDPEFDQLEETLLKTTVNTKLSENNNDNGEVEPTSNKARPEKVSNIINRLIEEDFQSNTSPQESGSEKRADSSEIEVKTEQTVDDSECGLATSSNNDTADESDSGNIVTAQSIENILSEQGSDQQAQYFASLMGLQPMGSSGGNYEGNSSPARRRSTRQSRKVNEKTWMDMVKVNVSKYQAALVKRSGQAATLKHSDITASTKQALHDTVMKRSSQVDEAKLHEMRWNEQIARAAENVAMVKPIGQGPAVSSLLNLLQKPPLTNSRLQQLISGDTERVGRSASFGGRDLERPARSSSVPRNIPGSNFGTERSSSCSPTVEVKIEVDDVEENYNCGSADTQTSDISNNKAATVKENSEKSAGGKLESRYPALVNQLQFSKQENVDKVATDEGESLVNRLPFISFQEIFSPAGSRTGPGGVPRMSESTTRHLLEQAKVKPSTYKPRSGKKSVWNWKKRVVKPKNDGNVVENLLSSESNEEHTENSSKKLFGMNFSSRKFFGRRNSKSKSDNDTDWKPTVEDEEEEIDGNSGAVGRSTRLSMGSKPRINFAEVDTTDSEELDEDFPDSGDPPEELVSAYCGKNCGKTFQSLYDLQVHEDFCRGVNNGNEMAPGGSQGAGSSNSVENFNCTLCGLDFNQEYRWHYHMIKVHGVTAEKLKFFR